MARDAATLCVRSVPVTLSATNDVVPEDKIVSTRTLAAAGLSKNTLDPLYPDFWMGQTNFSIDITARARRQGYPDFRARYGFRIRAVPVTEWAVFNPGRHREMVQLARDVSDTGHQAVHAYVGVVYSGGFSSAGTPASVTAASVSAGEPPPLAHAAAVLAGLPSTPMPHRKAHAVSRGITRIMSHNGAATNFGAACATQVIQSSTTKSRGSTRLPENTGLVAGLGHAFLSTAPNLT